MTLDQEFLIDELHAGLVLAADLVIAAKTWDETRELMVTRTYPFVRAIERAKDGWTRAEVEGELYATL